MLNSDFGKKCYDIATKTKTLYVLGGWGQPLTQANKNYFEKTYKKNGTDFKADIDAATSDTFAFDCVCFVKSVLDGFVGDTTKTYGGATYGKPCPDVTINDLLNKYCVDISTDVNNILIGEFIVSADYGHCGVYVGVVNGKRMVAESTYNKSYNGKSGVQLICMDIPERKSLWKYHGKLWYWMDYKYKDKSLATITTTPSVPTVLDVTTLKKMVNDKIIAKQGDKGDYVKEIQKVLIARGYSCGSAGADGVFGVTTKDAVIKFQTKRQLTANGIVNYDTMIKLIG